MWITDNGLVYEKTFKAPRFFFFFLFLKALNFSFNLKVVFALRIHLMLFSEIIKRSEISLKSFKALKTLQHPLKPNGPTTSQDEGGL